MKFSLLGLTDTSRPLADAIIAHPLHEISCIHSADTKLLQQNYPGVAFDPNWESVLHNSESDIAIVSDSNDAGQSEERLRRLIQAELPVIAVQPYLSLLTAFEMAMIQTQTGSPLFCYTPADLHPTATTIRNWVHDPLTSPIGPISQISIQAGSYDLNSDTLLRTAAFDIPIVRNLVGPVKQVSAMTSAPLQGPFDNLSITLKTASSTLITWNLDRSAAPEHRTLTLVGENQTCAFSLNSNHASWLPKGDTSPHPELPNTDPAVVFLETLPEKLHQPENDHSWLHWCQDLEIAETVPISLRRRRTIDILDEKRTEEGAFKGIMSMGGCGLLLATLLLLLFGSVIEGFRLPAKRRNYELQDTTPGVTAPINTTRSLWIRLWPAYPFLIFLLLQFFKLAILPPKDASPLSSAAKRPFSPADDHQHS